MGAPGDPPYDCPVPSAALEGASPAAGVPPTVQRAEGLYRDVDLDFVKTWKAAHPGRLAIGYLPVYVPREVLWATGSLPVGIMGGGDQVEVVRGDAFIQSYICHLPRSTIELAQSGRLDVLDGLLCPSTCDVIRNLSGMWKLLYPQRWAKYIDLPQNFDPATGGAHYVHQMRELVDELVAHGARKPSVDDLRASIRAYNESRRMLVELFDLRAREPWTVPTSELYLVVRAGNLLPPDEHVALLRAYRDEARAAGRRPVDNARVVVSGAFCEQPPLGLIKTIERAGCYIVDDDFSLIGRWLLDDVSEQGDPLEAIARAYLEHSVSAPTRYEPERRKGDYLVQLVGKRKAEGVLFAGPSFCDPALLERPMLMRACDRAGIAHTGFQYAENTGEFQGFREQAGTFSDSIKLWGNA